MAVKTNKKPHTFLQWKHDFQKALKDRIDNQI